MEVFLRLTDENGKLVQPQQFMQAAERYHLMGSLDRWVVRTALAALGQGAMRLPEGRSCTINLSAQSLGEDDFLEFVVECLDQSQVSPSQVCFEVTETALMADMERAERFASVLHGMGCQFGLDDFGSGVGALASLRGLDIDYLKIDGAYTHDLRAGQPERPGRRGHHQAREDRRLQGGGGAGGDAGGLRRAARDRRRLHPGLLRRPAASDRRGECGERGGALDAIRTHRSV